MPKFIISWDAGYGTEYDVVECESENNAIKEAYERWREDVENNSDYGVVGEATNELLEEYGL